MRKEVTVQMILILGYAVGLLLGGMACTYVLFNTFGTSNPVEVTQENTYNLMVASYQSNEPDLKLLMPPAIEAGPEKNVIEDKIEAKAEMVEKPGTRLADGEMKKEDISYNIARRNRFNMARLLVLARMTALQRYAEIKAKETMKRAGDSEEQAEDYEAENEDKENTGYGERETAMDENEGGYYEDGAFERNELVRLDTANPDLLAYCQYFNRDCALAYYIYKRKQDQAAYRELKEKIKRALRAGNHETKAYRFSDGEFGQFSARGPARIPKAFANKDYKEVGLRAFHHGKQDAAPAIY